MEFWIKKISEVRRLVTTTIRNTKIKEVDNKVPDLSGLVKKTDYYAKISRENTTSD